MLEPRTDLVVDKENSAGDHSNDKQFHVLLRCFSVTLQYDYIAVLINFDLVDRNLLIPLCVPDEDFCAGVHLVQDIHQFLNGHLVLRCVSVCVYYSTEQRPCQPLGYQPYL